MFCSLIASLFTFRGIRWFLHKLKVSKQQHSPVPCCFLFCWNYSNLMRGGGDYVERKDLLLQLTLIPIILFRTGEPCFPASKRTLGTAIFCHGLCWSPFIYSSFVIDLASHGWTLHCPWFSDGSASASVLPGGEVISHVPFTGELGTEVERVLREKQLECRTHETLSVAHHALLLSKSTELSGFKVCVRPISD